MKYFTILTVLISTLFCGIAKAEEFEVTPATIISVKNIVAVKQVIIANDLDEMKRLIAEGLDVNARDEDGNPLLYTALRENTDLRMAELLLKSGADANAPSEQNGMTPLIIATNRANDLQIQIGKFFEQEKNAELYAEKLKKSVAKQMHNAVDMVRMLLYFGADVNQETPFGTPLMNAASNAWNEEIITELLAAGADVNQRDRRGRTALFYATAAKGNKIMTQLIRAGADVNLRDSDNLLYLEFDKDKLYKD